MIIVLKEAIFKKDPDDVVMDLGIQQVSQTFRASLAIHTYILQYQLFGYAFCITFDEYLCTIGFLNADRFVQRLFNKQTKTKKDGSPLTSVDAYYVVEGLIRLH